MKNMVFYRIFLDFLQDIYDAENQVVKSLPLMIQNATNEDLRESLSLHLEETKDQVQKLKRVFELLGEQPLGKPCKGIVGLIEEGKEILQKPGITPHVKDCFIIISAQKIEHYEIASYGSAIALVEHMESAFKDRKELKEIREHLEDILEEEEEADKKLTQVAEGKWLMDGVNDEIEKELKVSR